MKLNPMPYSGHFPSVSLLQGLYSRFKLGQLSSDQHLTAQPLHRGNLRHNRWPWWDGWCFSALHQLYLSSLFFLLLLHFHWRRLGLWVSGLSTSSRNRGAEHTQRPLLACLAWRRTAIFMDLRQHMIAQLNIILAKRTEIGWGHSTLG